MINPLVRAFQPFGEQSRAKALALRVRFHAHREEVIMRGVRMMFLENLRRFRQGESLENVVDKEERY